MLDNRARQTKTLNLTLDNNAGGEDTGSKKANWDLDRMLDCNNEWNTPGLNTFWIRDDPSLNLHR